MKIAKEMHPPSFENDRRRFGWFALFSNVPVTVADTLLITTIVVGIVLWILGRNQGIMPYVLIMIAVWSLNMHCYI